MNMSMSSVLKILDLSSLKKGFLELATFFVNHRPLQVEDMLVISNLKSNLRTLTLFIIQLVQLMLLMLLYLLTLITPSLIHTLNILILLLLKKLTKYFQKN